MTACCYDERVFEAGVLSGVLKLDSIIDMYGYRLSHPWRASERSSRMIGEMGIMIWINRGEKEVLERGYLGGQG